VSTTRIECAGTERSRAPWHPTRTRAFTGASGDLRQPRGHLTRRPGSRGAAGAGHTIASW